MSVVYTVRRRDGLLVKVCRQSFMDISGVKKDRILNILIRYKDNNEMPLERRGGDRVRAKNNDKRIAIRRFVEGLKYVESHYCCSKTFQRLYLPAELSIRKLWKIYNSTVNRDLQVKESFFRFFLLENIKLVLKLQKQIYVQHAFNSKKKSRIPQMMAQRIILLYNNAFTKSVPIVSTSF
nr:unnamed protein product [Callosobruchus analis]